MGTGIAGIPAVMVTSTMLTLNCLKLIFKWPGDNTRKNKNLYYHPAI